MLLSVNQIIGLTIAEAKSGKKIDTVKDVVYDPVENRITAFIVKERNLFSDSYVLPFSSVMEMDSGMVLIQSRYDIKKVSNVPEPISYIARHNFYLSDSRIMTDSGRNLGIISDLFFDSETGLVKEMEVTQKTKFLGRTVSKDIIKVADILTVGQHGTIVRELPADVQKVDGEADQTNKQTSSENRTENIGWKRISFTDDYISYIEDKLQREDALTTRDVEDYKTYIDKAKQEDVIGMYLTKNILLDNDNFFAQSGELITHRMMEEAREQGVIKQVLQNASPLPPSLAVQLKRSTSKLLQ